MSDETTGVSLTAFPIDERPVVFVMDTSANTRFLDGIDPLFWSDLAESHSQWLNTDDPSRRQRAAAALRLAYGQGLETLFALLGALTQAPQFPLAWVATYRNSELRAVVRKIHQGTAVLSPLKRRATWHDLSEVVHEFVPEPTRSVVSSGFEGAWRRMAGEFLEDTFEPEYNSLKHGMRALVGGFSVAFGKQPSPGEPAPPEAMQTVGSTDFGSTFWMPPEKVQGCERTFNFGRHVSRAWVPDRFVAGLHLISMSIRNIASRALVHAGRDPSGLQFSWPADPELYAAPWRRHPSITNLSMGNTVHLGDWVEPTADRIRESFKFAMGPESD